MPRILIKGKRNLCFRCKRMHGSRFPTCRRCRKRVKIMRAKNEERIRKANPTTPSRPEIKYKLGWKS